MDTTMPMRRLVLLSALAPVAALCAVPATTVATRAAAPPSLSLSGQYIEHLAPGNNSPAAYGTAPQPFAGVAVGDVNGDGHPDVAAAFPDGNVVVLNNGLGVLNGSWPRSAGAGPVHAAPTLADLTGDGHLQVITTSESGYINVWNADGSNYPGWPQTSHPLASNFPKGYFSAVAVGDLFGNGGKELVAGSWDHTVYAWDRNGNTLANFPINTFDTIWDTPALADLEHLGQMDIVLGADSAGGSTEPNPPGGGMWAFRPNGGRLPFLSQTFDQTPWSSPAIADLANNHSNTVVIGTGLSFPDPNGHYLNAYGEAGFGWHATTGGRNFASPAVGHLQGPASAKSVAETGIDGTLYVFDANGNLQWSRNPGMGSLFGSPIIAPVDASGNNGIWIGAGQHLLAYDAVGNVVSDTLLPGVTWTNPTVASLNGSTLSVITTSQGTSAGPQAENTWVVSAFAIPGTTASMLDPHNKLQWPTFHYDMQRTGNQVGKIGPPPPPPPGVPGYWMTATDGGIFNYGAAQYYGSMGGIPLNKPVVGLARTRDGGGYWEVASDGGIFTFGDAHFWGSTGGIHLNQPIVGMAPTPSGNGYWLVASDGGIFPFGDAGGYGSTGNIRLNQPIVGMAATPNGGGYWLVASDGGIFPFGNAGGYGSTGAIRLNQPVVGMASTRSGRGYWLVASDGGIFPFGDAGGWGSTGNIRLNKPIVGMSASPGGNGYWLVASDGGIFPFGDAPQGLGSAGNIRLAAPVVGMASWG
jgi:hypothetical protein